MSPTPRTDESNASAGGSGNAVRDAVSERFGDAPFHQRVLEASPVGVATVDDAGTVVFANEAVGEVLDSSPAEMVGEPLVEFVDGLRVDDETGKPRGDGNGGERRAVLAKRATGDAVRLRVDTCDFALEGDQFTTYLLEEPVDFEPSEPDWFEALDQMSGYGLYRLDLDGYIEMVNDEVIDLTGYDREELLGVHASTVIDEDGFARCERAIGDLLEAEDETGPTVEFDALCADGEAIPCECQICLLRSNGRLLGTFGIVRDISDRRELTEEIRQQRGLIEHVLERSPVGIGVITPDGDIARVNDRAEELLGLTMEEISSQTFDVSQRKLYDPAGRLVSGEDLLSRVFDDREEVLNSEFTLERPDGDRVWASISIAPMMNGGGEVEKAVILATDITTRREREETLREERDVIESILETSPVGIGVITPDGDISRVNDRAEKLFGLTDFELSNRTFDVSQRNLYDPEGRRVAPEDLLSRVFDDREQVLNSEFNLEQPDNSHVWLSFSMAPIENREGDVEKAVLIGRDVTGRRAREETLREERDVIESILETSPVGIGVITPDGDISRVNNQAEELLGLTIEEITNQTLDVSQRRFYGASGQRVPPEDLLSQVFDDRKRVLNSEFNLERPDGERVWTALSMAPIESHTGDVEKAVVIATDISERKEREKRLRESEARLRQIAENINSAIWMADADLSEVLYINPAYEDITGRSRDSVYDKLMNHLDAVHPQDRRRVEQALKKCASSSIRDAGAFRFQEKYRIIRPDGAVRWVNSFAFPLQNDTGSVYRFVGVIDDITEVKEQQLELGRHRDELETLNQINTVIRRVNQGLVRAATREEIEAQVCETLTDSKLYNASWIGEVDRGGRTITSKAGDGIHATFLDWSFDEVDAIATTVETGDLKIVRDLETLPPELIADEPDEAGTFGYGHPSAAVIPLLYKETIYDVLVVYSSRANAFSVREQAVLFELGTTIGLAINAVQRKDALLTDPVVELTFAVDDRDEFFGRTSAELGAEFEMNGIATQSDGSYLQYFTVTGVSPDRVLESASDDPAVEHARLVAEDENGALVEFVVDAPSLAVTLAEYGGTVQSATFADGRGTIATTFPRTADVRNVADVVRSTFSESELVSKSERERSVPSDRGFQAMLEEALTERQRATLATAYYAGYFEWPRDSSGEEVADALSIAPATFHQHVRGGVQKLVETFVDGAGA